MKTGVAAIFGPQSPHTASHVQSICDTMEVKKEKIHKKQSLWIIYHSTFTFIHRSMFLFIHYVCYILSKTTTTTTQKTLG
jgi:hypothetical protein